MADDLKDVINLDFKNLANVFTHKECETCGDTVLELFDGICKKCCIHFGCSCRIKPIDQNNDY